MLISYLPLLQPDHLAVRVNDAQKLHRLFTEVLGLPISWPLQCLTFATFSWVSVGNINIEFWQASNNSDLPLDGKPLIPFVHGMAVDCDRITQTVAQLSDIGFACSPAKTFGTSDADGLQVDACTKAQLLEISAPMCQVFLCHWHREGLIFPWKEKLSTAERRVNEKRAFSASGGGILGILGLAEIRMRVPDIQHASHGWDLASRRMAKEGYFWDLGNSIVLSMHEGPSHMMTTLLFRVNSLEKAKDALYERGLLGEHTTDEAQILPEAVDSLDFRLVQ
jgi:hypothetical protein